MILLDLFLGFLKVGLFAFGGAYGAIPLIRDVVVSCGWLSEDALTGMIAVSESTPGPIMVNVATYVGFSQAGIPGALAATTAVVLPSFAVVLLIAALLHSLVRNAYVQAVLKGMKPAMAGIILATGLYLTLRNVTLSPSVSAVVMTVLLAMILWGSRLVTKKGISPIAFICLAALLGVAVFHFA